MASEYDYIDAYFTKTLSDQEKKAFEDRCLADEAFANEVAFYLSSRQAVREALLEHKQKQWSQAPDAGATIHYIKPANKTFIRRWLPYAAAACIVLAIAVYFVARPASPKQLAADYFNKNYAQLGIEMGKTDSLQTAIADYNNKEYNKALALFLALQNSHPANSGEKKYVGLVYLAIKDYDKALEQFNALAATKSLFGNDGDLLKAITLLERDNPNDKEKAKQILQQIVNTNEAGSEEARKWLQRF